MRIAVTTPTGNVGRHVVAMLVRAGVRPLVLARDPERLDPEIWARWCTRSRSTSSMPGP